MGRVDKGPGLCRKLKIGVCGMTKTEKRFLKLNRIVNIIRGRGDLGKRNFPGDKKSGEGGFVSKTKTLRNEKRTKVKFLDNPPPTLDRQRAGGNGAKGFIPKGEGRIHP